MNKEKPNPGSDEALKMGCKCPVLDNRHGKGSEEFGEDTFWVNENCPIHSVSNYEKAQQDMLIANFRNIEEKPK